jgi:hypothetical protein
MNIIFGDELDIKLDNYTLLELDTLQDIETGKKITAWCVIDNILFQDLPSLESYKQVHQALICCYKKKEWESCQDGIRLLKGQWNGELDSFYDILEQRIQELAHQELGSDWSGVILKNF